MSYIYTAVVSMKDPDAFAAAGKTWAEQRARTKFGALSSSAMQIVMGGESAGLVYVNFEYETADAAMAGFAALYADKKYVTLIREQEVKIHLRSLMRVQAEFGARDGQFASILQLGGRPVDDKTTLSNFRVNWGHIKRGANGLTVLQPVAAGPVPFSGIVLAWTDSLDGLLAAATKNFADPKVQEHMAASGSHVLGRLLARRLF